MREEEIEVRESERWEKIERGGRQIMTVRDSDIYKE